MFKLAMEKMHVPQYFETVEFTGLFLVDFRNPLVLKPEVSPSRVLDIHQFILVRIKKREELSSSSLRPVSVLLGIPTTSSSL